MRRRLGRERPAGRPDRPVSRPFVPGGGGFRFQPLPAVPCIIRGRIREDGRGRIILRGIPEGSPGWGGSGILTRARPSLPKDLGQCFARARRFTDSGLMPRICPASAYVIQTSFIGRTIGEDRSSRQSSRTVIFPSHTALMHRRARPTAKSQGLARLCRSAGRVQNAECS